MHQTHKPCSAYLRDFNHIGTSGIPSIGVYDAPDKNGKGPCQRQAFDSRECRSCHHFAAVSSELRKPTPYRKHVNARAEGQALHCDGNRSRDALAHSNIIGIRENKGVNIEALLSQVPLFSGLEPDEIARIARGTREMTARRGDILFHKGDSSKGFHLVVSGQIKLAFTSSQGGEKVVDIMGQGQTFGESAILMEQPYMVYAQALVNSQLLHISKSVILKELDSNPRLARKMIAVLSIRLHHLIADVESYSLHSGRQRIIGYLLRENMESDAKSLTVMLPTHKGVIASRLNLTLEHFSRILHELVRNGLITVQGRKIGIPDVEKLRDYDLLPAA